MLAKFRNICAIVAFSLAATVTLAAPGEIVALQGLYGYTLVAGKTTAMRMYMNATILERVDSVSATIIRPDGSKFDQKWAKAEVVSIATGSRGASVVVRVTGVNLPWIGTYQVVTNLLDSNGAALASYELDDMKLMPTKDLIVGLDRASAPGVNNMPPGVNPAPATEIQGARDALTRLAAILPIRDGVSEPDGDRTAGFRYVINNSPQDYGCNAEHDPNVSNCQMCPFFASRINRPVGSDVMNLGIEYRYQDAGESMGGIAPIFCPNQSVGQAHVVMTAPSAPGIAQESGHVFGLEPTDDPHYDLTVQAHHSKDNTIGTTAAEEGFDPQTNAAYPVPTYDAMHQVVCGCQNNEVTYNVWDWNYLRSKFAELASTGPGLPNHFTSDSAPSVAGTDQSVYFFVRRADGRIAYNRAPVGQAGIGWTEVDGSGVTDRTPASAAAGARIFVAIKGMDGRIQLNEGYDGKGFGSWVPMSFVTDAAPALAVVGDRLFVIAKGTDRKVYASQGVIGQGPVGQGFSGWSELQGGGLTDAAPSAAGTDSKVFVAIKGLDGRLELNQADLGKAWSGWTLLKMSANVPPALATVSDHLVAFATTIDGRIVLAQAILGQSFSDWVEVQGSLRSATSPAAASIGSHIFVSARRVDGGIVTNQADLNGLFGRWL
jgi:hypothetical protein